jgi:hypothetical protein
MRASLVPWVVLGAAALGSPALPAPARAQVAPAPPVTPEAPPDVPGLSAEEIQELREGRGMGLARVADVLGYPGPRHVLEAFEAGQLPLRAEQAARIRAIVAAMAADARRLGAGIVAAEAALADAFRAGSVDADGVRARVDRIAALRGELRAVHLQAHVRTRAVLDAAQVARYAELRGHAPRAGAHGHGH